MYDTCSYCMGTDLVSNSMDIQHRPITNIEDKSRMIKVQDMYSYFRVQIFDDVEVSPSFQEMLRRMIAIKDQSWY